MKAALITALIKLGLEKGMTQKVRPKFLGLKILAFTLIFIGTLFLLIALHQLLTIHYSRLVANSCFGGSFVLLAIIVLIVINKKQREKEKQPPADPLADLQQMAQPLLDSAQQAKEKAQATIYRHQGKIIIGTLLVGALLGRFKASKSYHRED